MKTVVVLPAYNASATLRRTLDEIPYEVVDEVILVDDASADGTYELARELAATHPRLTDTPGEAGERRLLTVAKFERNRGYGGNQKRCYDLALARGADLVVMLHPDYQYDPKLITHFVSFIEEGYFDVMLGSRIRTRREAVEGGMPLYKYYSNRALTFVQNLATGQALSEWHTGMRAYTKEALAAVPYRTFSDDFVFDTQILLAIVGARLRIGEIPVPVRYFPEASSIGLRRSLRYGLLTVLETLKFAFRRSGIVETS